MGKFLFSILVTLLVLFTVFTLDAVGDTNSISNDTLIMISFSVGVLIVVGIIWVANRLYRKTRTFLKEHSSLLSSEDPKVLSELVEKCDTYLKDRHSPEVVRFARQAKDKREKIQREMNFQANLETFKSEISEDGSHPRVVSTVQEQMHNPDSFQHVSSDYEIVEQDGMPYRKIVMTFRGRNTFNALVLQTCYFLVDADNQITLVGSPDDSESSPINTGQLSASVDAAANAFEGVASLADLLLFFTSEDSEE